MTDSTAVGPSVFVLGQESRGNREVRIYETGESYSVEVGTLTAYTQQTTRFPYTGV